MRALVAVGPGDFRLSELAELVVPEGGRLVEVEAAGVCAADRMLWRGDGPWELCWPFVPGHELLGHDVLTGQRLTVEVKIPCGRCRWCSRGKTNLCPHGTHVGSGIPGAFAERLALPAAALVHPVPEALPLAAAVLAEPAACALHAVRRAGVKEGDTVAVIGIGAVGALALHAARAEGASVVLAVTRTPEKAALSLDLGADEALDITTGARDLADVVLECSGDPAAAARALDLAAPGGTVGLYGVYRSHGALDLNQIAEHKELTIAGGHLAPGCFPEAILLLAGVRADLIVTAVRPLDQAAAALEPSSRPRLKEVLVP
ncbi:MAG: zinc-dependent alcohol dehydrogenase [Egibacteraceae bacterium]